MADLIDIDAVRIAPYLVRAIEGFIYDPPSSDGGSSIAYQRGYLAALLAIYQEALSRGRNDARIIAAERILRETADD